jgi:adenine-specific DNA-methyltransferase
MPTANRILQLEDLRSARSPEAVRTIFSKLGYKVHASLTPLPKEQVEFNPADTLNIRTLYLLSTQGNPARETALQIFLIEVDRTGLIRLRSLARNLMERGINVLLIATGDHYRFLHFVHPRRDGNKIRIRKLVVDTTRPTRHDLDILEGLAVQGRDPAALYAQHQSTFDIEKVTKRFYGEYAALFKRVAEAIKANNRGVRAFVNDEGELHGFTQRLLGRLMFLYFLQKKGWLNGDPQFLTTQYRRAIADEHLYFATILRPLFFDVLNRRRPNDDSPFGNIPYLNGGLFDQTPIEKEENGLYLPNSIFDPEDEGILALFNLYNFTITEETPIEQEVAVDPEMLGKVFENMMEERERQDFGTFYTHRAIVQYMCREALVDYLSRETKVSVERLNALFESDEEEAKPELTVREARAIEGALDQVRILDPAVGTGAFLVGALQEMIALRRVCQRAMGNQVSRGGGGDSPMETGNDCPLPLRGRPETGSGGNCQVAAVALVSGGFGTGPTGTSAQPHL